MGKQDYDVENVHPSYLKLLLKVKPSSCTPAVCALFIKQKIQILKYWKRLLNSEKSTIIKNAYNSLYESFELSQINWCCYDIIAEADRNHQWNEQYISNTEIKAISGILHECFILKTLSDLSNPEMFPKLRTYEKYKVDFRLENHLVFLENHGHKLHYQNSE